HEVIAVAVDEQRRQAVALAVHPAHRLLNLEIEVAPPHRQGRGHARAHQRRPDRLGRIAREHAHRDRALAVPHAAADELAVPVDQLDGAAHLLAHRARDRLAVHPRVAEADAPGDLVRQADGAAAHDRAWLVAAPARAGPRTAAAVIRVAWWHGRADGAAGAN